MKKNLLIATMVIGVLVLFTLLYFSYMKATSYECVSELPPKPIISNSTGDYYYGNMGKLQIISKCKGGILAKFPIK